MMVIERCLGCVRRAARAPLAWSTEPANELRRISSGCFIAESGAAKQNWHTDGPSLAPAHLDLRPYALNVFVPLVPISGHNGTGFLPGSHLDATIDGPDAVGRYSAQYVAPKVDVGDVIIFDYRVWHRGLGNSTVETRPVCYATYSPSWFVDTQNFSTARYKRKLDVDVLDASRRANR